MDRAITGQTKATSHPWYPTKMVALSPPPGTSADGHENGGAVSTIQPPKARPADRPAEKVTPPPVWLAAPLGVLAPRRPLGGVGGPGGPRHRRLVRRPGHRFGGGRAAGGGPAAQRPAGHPPSRLDHPDP